LKRLPKIGEKVKQDGVEYKIVSECLGVYYGRAKYVREDTELDLEKIQFLTAETLSRDDMFKLVSFYVKEEFLKNNFINEVKILGRLRKKYPDLSFWREYFRPGYKVKGLMWFFGGGAEELEKQYKLYTIDLTRKPEKAIIGDTKIGEDLPITKRARNLLDLLK
jgi:hypothetical protein